jgi:Zn-finger nucleic acid-binding protein
MCDTCKGVWLDRGEIEKIAAFLKYCGLPEKVKKELAEIKAIYDRHGEGGEDVRDDLDDLGEMILSIIDTWDL